MTDFNTEINLSSVDFYQDIRIWIRNTLMSPRNTKIIIANHELHKSYVRRSALRAEQSQSRS